MQANEFEKKVQQVMGEFKISPSGAVWQEVERRIQEKKRRRRVLFFIVFSCIGLALAGYGIYNSSHQQSNSQSEIVHQEKIRTAKPTMLPHSVANKSANENIAITKQQVNETAKSNTSITGQKETAVTRPVSSTSKLLDQRQPADKYIDNPTGKSAVVDDNSLPQKETRVTAVELDQKMHADQVKENISRTTLIDSTLLQILQSSRTGQDQNQSFGRISKNLQWGINFSAGSSLITENHFSFKNSASLADISYSSPGTSSAGGAPRLPASLNESVFAFKAGIVVKKHISLRSQLSAGLQYAFLGDHIKAATASTRGNSQQGSSFNFSSYYSAAPQKTHEDRFHFVELPIMYHWRMSKNDNRFLSLNAGVTGGYLLGSNALIYDTSYMGIYFHDESLLTKAHFNLTSGISYHLAGVNGFEWSIGPQFSFDLSRIIKSDVDKRRYLLYAGIDTRVFFENKKKK